MARFNYFNDMNKQLALDGDLKNQIKPRWQRKMENSINSSASMLNQSKLSVSYNSSYVSALNTTNNGNKTPNKQTSSDPVSKKSPGESIFTHSRFKII
jgi:hypothetical protein